MAPRRSFLLRVDTELLDAVQRWANDDLRSLNAQIEFLLRRALRDAGRAGPGAAPPEQQGRSHTPGDVTSSPPAPGEQPPSVPDLPEHNDGNPS